MAKFCEVLCWKGMAQQSKVLEWRGGAKYRQRIALSRGGIVQYRSGKVRHRTAEAKTSKEQRWRGVEKTS